MDVSSSESSSIWSFTAVKPLTGERPPVGGLGWGGGGGAWDWLFDQKYQPAPASTRRSRIHHSQERPPLLLIGTAVSMEGVLTGVEEVVTAGVEGDAVGVLPFRAA